MRIDYLLWRVGRASRRVAEQIASDSLCQISGQMMRRFASDCEVNRGGQQEEQNVTSLLPAHIS